MPRIVSRDEWIAERQRLLVEEKEFTRRRDALAERRRALPWVKVEKDYEFDSAQGRVKFADLFRGRSQLWVQSVMQGPGQPLQCVGCALGIDHVEGLLPHLENHDLSYVAVARATMPELPRAMADPRPWWVLAAGFGAAVAGVALGARGRRDAGESLEDVSGQQGRR